MVIQWLSSGHQVNEAGQVPFREVALELLANYRFQLTNLKQQKASLSELKRYAFPVLGGIPIENFCLRYVADALPPLCHERDAAARKVREPLSRTCTSDGTRISVPARWNDDSGNCARQIEVNQWKRGGWVQLGQNINSRLAEDHSGCSVVLLSSKIFEFCYDIFLRYMLL